MNYGWSAGVSMNFGLIVGKWDYKPTFSDFAGEAVNGAGGSWHFIGGGYGHTAAYSSYSMSFGVGTELVIKN